MTLQKTNRTSIMASFATLKSLSDVKKYQSPYQILREFINYIIVSDSLYSFSAVEMKNCLNSHFSFSIPEAVVKINKVKKLEQKVSQEDVKRMRIGEIENLKSQRDKKLEELEEQKNVKSSFEILGVMEIR